jgi:hypothetical protein
MLSFRIRIEAMIIRKKMTGNFFMTTHGGAVFR